ncbi:MAG: hemerythrin domain-containing protein [Polyangiaceae bacterium]
MLVAACSLRARGVAPAAPLTYCTGRYSRKAAPLNAIDWLVKQHRRMEASFEAALEGGAGSQRALFDETADLLMSHVLVEEEHFYPAVEAKRTKDVLLESLEEHLSLKRVLADLVALPEGDEHFVPKLHVLKEQAEHHHKEEEEHLFPKARKLLADAELAALGERMEAAQLKLLEEQPRKRAASQTEAAAKL